MAAVDDAEKFDPYGKGVPRANTEIMANRVDKFIELISLCKPTHEVLRVGVEEWGLSKRGAEQILAKARRTIRERWNNQDRQDFVASALEKADQIAKLSIETKQLSNAIGAINLQAKLLQITKEN